MPMHEGERISLQGHLRFMSKGPATAAEPSFIWLTYLLCILYYFYVLCHTLKFLDFRM